MQTTERAHGLILRTRPFTETSLIVNWLTPEFGRISTVAKGARRPKSPFAATRLFYEGDFSFQRSRRSELHTLREVVLRGTNTALRHELGYLHQASYCAMLLEQTTETQTRCRRFTDCLWIYSHAAEATAQTADCFRFRTQIAACLGLSPDVESSKLPAERVL